MNPYLQEVLGAYVPIERWLSQGEESAEALMTRFTAESIMTSPDGGKMDYLVMSRSFHHAEVIRPGLHIVVSQAKTASGWHDGTAVRYRGSQTLADGSENVRWSTAIFQQAEGKMIWHHPQEARLGWRKEKGPDCRGGLFERKDFIRGRASRYSALVPTELSADDVDLPPGSTVHIRG